MDPNGDEHQGKTPRRNEEELCSANWSIPCFLEKPRVEMLCRPYRKPTQVGWESIPRRLRDLWSRNSAKYSRNFGRRLAPA